MIEGREPPADDDEPFVGPPEPEDPVDDQPVDDEPVDEDPLDDEPVDEDPLDDKPVDEDPVADKPVDEEPVAEEPVADQPVDEEPVDDPDDDDSFVGPPAPEEPADDPDDDSPGDGSGATISVDKSCALADAISSANTDSAVGGCVAGNGNDAIKLLQNVTLSADLPVINSDISIDGGTLAGLAGKRSISGNDARRIFTVGTSGTLRLKDVKLIKGSAWDGGALYNSGTVTILDVDFEDNAASDEGGAIYNEGALSINDGFFKGNSSENIGGAIYNASGGTISSVTNTEFKGNTAANGGAIYNIGDITMSSASFSGNAESAILDDMEAGCLYVTDRAANITLPGNQTCCGCVTDTALDPTFWDALNMNVCAISQNLADFEDKVDSKRERCDT